jgi:hypothetical protein
LGVGEIALRLEVGGADEEVVVDEAVEAGRMICRDDYLMPDVRWIDGGDRRFSDMADSCSCARGTAMIDVRRRIGVQQARMPHAAAQPRLFAVSFAQVTIRNAAAAMGSAPARTSPPA